MRDIRQNKSDIPEKLLSIQQCPDCDLYDRQIVVLQPSQQYEVLSKSTTLPYSIPNLTTMLSGVTDPVFVLQRVDANGNPYPFTFRARDQTEFTTADFDTVWNLLLSNPDQPIGKL